MADEREPEGWAGLRRRVRRFLVAGLVVTVLALVAGLVLGRFFPRLVATRSISPLVLSEAVGDPDARVTDGPAPSSGLLGLEAGADSRLLDRFLLAYLDTGPERGGCPGPGS